MGLKILHYKGFKCKKHLTTTKDWENDEFDCFCQGLNFVEALGIKGSAPAMSLSDLRKQAKLLGEHKGKSKDQKSKKSCIDCSTLSQVVSEEQIKFSEKRFGKSRQVR